MKNGTIFGLVLVCFSCGPSAVTERHGLPLVRLEMPANAVAEWTRGALAKIDPAGQLYFKGKQYPVRISAAGHSTLRELKKSFDLEIIGADPANQKEVELGASQLRFATTIRDRSMLRALLSLEIARASGIEASEIEPVFVQLNDRNLGLYFKLEKINGDFKKHHHLKWTQLWQADEDADFKPDMRNRLSTAFKGSPKPVNLELIRLLAERLEMEDDQEFSKSIFEILDRVATVNYMAYCQLANHSDGFNKNLYWFKPEASKGLRYLVWDFDLDFRSDILGTVNPWRGNRLFTRIGNLPDVRAEIIARRSAILASGMNAPYLIARIAEWKSKIADAYGADPIFQAQKISLEQETKALADEITQWYGTFSEIDRRTE